VHVCHLLHVTAVRQDIASAVWRAYSQLAYAARYPASAVAKAGKFPPFLRKIFNDDPNFFGTFLVEPLVIYNCALYNLKLSQRLRDIRLFKYPLTLKPGLGVTQVHRKLYH